MTYSARACRTRDGSSRRRRHWEAIGKYDPEHHTRLVVDEWGVWYRPGEEIAPAYLLSQPLTPGAMRLHTAVTFDVSQPPCVMQIAMANVAQTINCIHCLFLAQGDNFVRTPVYYVFEMYRGHMQSQVAQMNISTVTNLERLLRIAGISDDAGAFWFGFCQGSKVNGDLDESIIGVASCRSPSPDERKYRRRARQRSYPRRYDCRQHIPSSRRGQAGALSSYDSRRQGGGFAAKAFCVLSLELRAGFSHASASKVVNYNPERILKIAPRKLRLVLDDL